MHPQPFVAKLVAEGKINSLSRMIREYSDRLYEKKTSDHHDAYAFANSFLISVLGKLRNLEPGQSLDDDKLLSVWMDLGLFGIDREDIRVFLEKEEEASH